MQTPQFVFCQCLSNPFIQLHHWMMFYSKSGKLYYALNSQSMIQSSDPWIIDSGPSDHMTCSSNCFHSYVHFSKHISVKITDGSFTLVVCGDIKLSSNLILKFVFHVSALKCNLISVSKITRDNHCVANFLSSSCQFQDLSSGKTIGSARVHDGLYYFDDDHPKSR